MCVVFAGRKLSPFNKNKSFFVPQACQAMKITNSSNMSSNLKNATFLLSRLNLWSPKWCINFFSHNTDPIILLTLATYDYQMTHPQILVHQTKETFFLSHNLCKDVMACSSVNIQMATILHNITF